MREVKFAKVHMFPYSERPRTRAALMPNKVTPEIIKMRKQEVLRVAEQTAYELRRQFLHQKMTVLTESSDPSRPHQISGHTENFLSVWVDSCDYQPNELVQVELIENTPSGLIGRVIGSSQKVCCG